MLIVLLLGLLLVALVAAALAAYRSIEAEAKLAPRAVPVKTRRRR